MSIYKSSTHGPIPLSATGKRLMHALRVAIHDAIQAADYNCQDKVAHARGELAKYISTLEARQPKAGFHDFSKGFGPKPGVATEADLRRQAELAKNASSNTCTWYVGSKPWRAWYGGNFQNFHPQNLLDDPQNEQELDMSKKAIAARKKAADKMQLVGVRFLQGHSLDKIYTYKAKRTAKLTLGCEVVVRNDSRGTSVGIVVQLDQPMPFSFTMESIVELTDKVVAL